METNSEYYIDLIARYFFGEATPGEIRELEEWVKADPANRDLFSGYKRTWQAVEDSKSPSPADIDREWKDLRSRIGAGRVAGTAEPGTAPVIRSLNAPGSRQGLPSRFVSLALRIAAVMLLVVIPSFFLYRYFTATLETRLAAGNEIALRTLPDGTTVTLNAGATLSYPSRFRGSSRNVTLQGEAWFEVSHDRSKPFIITSGNAKVEVVGTSFYVNTRTFRNSEEVILATGRVRVYFAGHPSDVAVLSPGDRAEMMPNSCNIRTGRNEDPNYLSWKTKHMVFSNAPLNEVAALLSKVYHTSVSISGSGLRDCRITTTFDKQSLESVLNVLKATLDLQVRNTGAGIELSGHGCN